jgi:hypothetical protein
LGDDNIRHWQGNAWQAIVFKLFFGAEARPGNVVAHLPLEHASHARATGPVATGHRPCNPCARHRSEQAGLTVGLHVRHLAIYPDTKGFHALWSWMASAHGVDAFRATTVARPTVWYHTEWQIWALILSPSARKTLKRSVLNLLQGANLYAHGGWFGSEFALDLGEGVDTAAFLLGGDRLRGDLEQTWKRELAQALFAH